MVCAYPSLCKNCLCEIGLEKCAKNEKNVNSYKLCIMQKSKLCNFHPLLSVVLPSSLFPARKGLTDMRITASWNAGVIWWQRVGTYRGSSRWSKLGACRWHGAPLNWEQHTNLRGMGTPKKAMLVFNTC